MDIVLLGLSIICGLVSLVCFVLVIVAMFQNQQTGMGIVCLVLALCGIGFLIAFIYGWIKSGEWKLTPVMLGWSGAIAVGLVVRLIGGTSAMSF